MTASSAPKPEFVSYDDWINRIVMIGSAGEEEELRETYDSLVQDFTSWQYPITLYRAVVLNDISELRTEHVGSSWTWDEDMAVPYSGPLHGTTFILKAVCPEPSIDWDTTLEMGLCGSEMEIKVAYGKPLTLVGYRRETDSEWTPVNKTITG